MSERLHILQHALGLDEFGRLRRGQDRNHYVIGAGAPAHDECMSLVAEGLMTRREPSELTGGMDLFFVTAAGRSWAQNNSPAPPKRTRSQKRYEAFLAADCGMKFGEFLRSRPRA